jgi:hypothetical protein
MHMQSHPPPPLPYRFQVASRSSSGRRPIETRAGRHFAPASLLPYGGFGDPDNPAPYWRSAEVSPDKLKLSKAQDRLVRAVRQELQRNHSSAEHLEERLGYRRYALTRKLNGQELMTLRDILNIGSLYPGSLLALAEPGGDNRTAQEPQPEFQSNTTVSTSEDDPVHDALQTAAAALEDASSELQTSRKGANAKLAPMLKALAVTINEVGRAFN